MTCDASFSLPSPKEIFLKFSLPYNGDPQIIDIVLSEYASHVVCFYGSLGIDGFGGGRVLKQAQHSSVEDLKKIVQRLDKHNIEFNYVINSTNQLNREFDPDYLESFKNFVGTLVRNGIRTITLCNPFFIQLTREWFGDLRISASVNLKIRSLMEARYAVELGCDEITLHYDILKSAPILRSIRENCPDTSLKLIPNDVYIMNCPWQKGHTRMQGAKSRANEIETPYFSYYRNKCVNLRNFKPEEIYKAMWIAPDQLQDYVALGYDHFKLLDRLASTQWNIRTLQAYISGEPMSNMEMILGTYGRKHTGKNLDELSPEDPPYPLEKLEFVPELKPANKQAQVVRKYWIADNHPDTCGSCQSCSTVQNVSAIYPESRRKQAIEHNRIWQSSITKIPFIEKLNSEYVQRIRYAVEDV